SNYARRFAALFRDGVTKANVTRAIATFERTLVAVDSPFDRWLRGDQSALDADEVAGYELFKSVGCIACHQGRNVGGNMYQRFGVLGDYFRDRGQLTDEDRGRFNVTQDESDRFVFRVPSLRMVEHTAPYFHDGSAATLQDAVRVMVRYQLGRRLADEEIARIVRFLRTLDGPMPRAIPPQIGPLELPSSAGAR
ncbi:MAG: c-type cytochrome, partial [Sandaracinaceae bacterium]|nr:c-type cytochrome [Sandaracinaceae bacterium]